MTQIVVTLERGADGKKQEWTDKMNWLSDNFDKSVIDYDDERVKYILSK